MGAAIELLNFWGGRFVQFAWPMLVQSSVVMVVVVGLNWALERRVRAVVRYALLLLVLVKLVLPPSLAVPTGVGYWVGPAIKPVETAVIAPQIGWPSKEAPSPSLAKAAPLQPNVGHSVVPTKDPVPAGSTEAGKANPTSVGPSVTLSWQAMCFITWCVGVVGLAAYVLRRSWQVFQLTAQAEDAAGDLPKIFLACREELHIRRKIRLKVSEFPASPAVCGVFRPVILVPKVVAEKLSTVQLRAVLLHEFGHLKRGDLWVNHLQTLLQILYWYNPLLWVANALIRRVREEAVDELVMVNMCQEAEVYPATLLEVAKATILRSTLSLGLVGIAESRGGLKERIQRLLTQPIPRSAKVGLVGALMVSLVAGIVLPMAKGQLARREDSVPHELPIQIKVAPDNPEFSKLLKSLQETRGESGPITLTNAGSTATASTPVGTNRSVGESIARTASAMPDSMEQWFSNTIQSIRIQLQKPGIDDYTRKRLESELKHYAFKWAEHRDTVRLQAANPSQPLDNWYQLNITSIERRLADPDLSERERKDLEAQRQNYVQERAENRKEDQLWAKLTQAIVSQQPEKIRQARQELDDYLARKRFGVLDGTNAPKGMNLEELMKRYTTNAGTTVPAPKATSPQVSVREKLPSTNRFIEILENGTVIAEIQVLKAGGKVSFTARHGATGEGQSQGWPVFKATDPKGVQVQVSVEGQELPVEIKAPEIRTTHGPRSEVAAKGAMLVKAGGETVAEVRTFEGPWLKQTKIIGPVTLAGAPSTSKTIKGAGGRRLRLQMPIQGQEQPFEIVAPEFEVLAAKTMERITENW